MKKLDVAMRLYRFVLWGDPYRRWCGETVEKPVGNRVLRMAGYAFCGMVLIVALLMATTEPNDHTRFHSTSRHVQTKNFK